MIFKHITERNRFYWITNKKNKKKDSNYLQFCRKIEPTQLSSEFLTWLVITQHTKDQKLLFVSYTVCVK